MGLNGLAQSDPAFAAGLAKDGPANLNDPAPANWDPLFRPAEGAQRTRIDGMLKVAGDSRDSVNTKLDDIKNILGFPTIIHDIAAQSLPTTTNSRVNGVVRPKAQGLNGHEQ